MQYVDRVARKVYSEQSITDIFETLGEPTRIDGYGVGRNVWDYGKKGSFTFVQGFNGYIVKGPDA
jgi:hypothetical protein